MLYRQEDLPFTVNGISPELIINPHAIPSRMTIGQLIECLQGKVGCLAGRAMSDATPFGDLTVRGVSAQLHALGFQQHGNEMFHNGQTGEIMRARIFVGPTFYQRLKHMVADKIHARAKGMVQGLNRQPVKGRSREGGGRFGEMERDTLIAHGATALLADRMRDSSDGTIMHVCARCGMFAVAPPNTTDSKFYCKSCPEELPTDVVQVRMPYATKLLLQEIQSMNIAPRIRVQRI
eukprot:gnl/Ergobibamus_cyprinoides/903.p1 GENE.gnl/Ergobibamus_cyprinoides/903~~gnl/Ergobibamus_cyprinoides/903.p1  ORF type:complete len:253 (+),score=63.50 gnl/Ergobibamus_cyprinoides/903:56-760(+)